MEDRKKRNLKLLLKIINLAQQLAFQNTLNFNGEGKYI